MSYGRKLTLIHVSRGRAHNNGKVQELVTVAGSWGITSSILNTKQKEQTGSGIRMWTIKAHPPLKDPKASPNSTTNLRSNTAYERFFFYLNNHGMHSMEYIVNDVHTTDSQTMCFSAHILSLCEMWRYWTWTHVSHTYWSWPSSEAEDILEMGEDPISILESSSWPVESPRARGKRCEQYQKGTYLITLGVVQDLLHRNLLWRESIPSVLLRELSIVPTRSRKTRC